VPLPRAFTKYMQKRDTYENTVNKLSTILMQYTQHSAHKMEQPLVIGKQKLSTHLVPIA